MSCTSFPPLLLVDGYNIIGLWSSLSQTRDRYGLEMARLELGEALINYSAFRDYKIQVVFDAYNQPTPLYKEDLTPHVAVYYTAFGETADTYIEKLCASFFRELSPLSSRLIVATSDRAQQLTAVGYGAEWMSAKQLMNEVDLTTKRLRCKQRPQKQARGRFLFHSLDSKSQQRLAQMRHGFRP